MTIDYLLMNYSGSELLALARKGLLYIDSYDVSKIVCAATEELYSQSEYDKHGEDAWLEGHSTGYQEAREYYS